MTIHPEPDLYNYPQAKLSIFSSVSYFLSLRELFNLAKIGKIFEQRYKESSTISEWFYWYGHL